MSERAKRSNLSVLFWFAVLITAIIVVRWIVITKRAPGAMTPLEAQGMTMSATPIPSAVPVSVAAVTKRAIYQAEEFPATVAAYSDEEVVARIPGRVVLMPVYPGDNVRAGQLLARLAADEYATQAAQAAAAGRAGLDMATVAEREIERLKALRNQQAVGIGAMAAGVRQTLAERDAASAETLIAKEGVQAKQSALDQMQAELTFQQQEFERDNKLFKAGAISLQELQSSRAKRDVAAAKASSAKSELEQSRRQVDVATKKLSAAESNVTQAQGHHEQARKEVQTTDKEIARAKAELQVKRAEAKAALAGAGTSKVIAGYRELRALDNAVVSERLVSPGSLVQAGQTVLRLRVLNKVRIQAKVPTKLAGSIRVGDAVAIKTNGTSKQTKLSSVFPSQDPATRTFIAEAIFENKDRALLPGMFLRLKIAGQAATERLAIPRIAIMEDASGGRYVWVATRQAESGIADWTCLMHPQVSKPGPGKCPICGMPLVKRQMGGDFVAKKRSIETGASDGEYVAVLSGLRENEMVITSEGAAIMENTRVTLR